MATKENCPECLCSEVAEGEQERNGDAYRVALRCKNARCRHVWTVEYRAR